MNKIVINTSPLIVLFKSKQADLLPQIFQEIVITDGVWNEVVRPSYTDLASKQLPLTSWVKRLSIPQVSPVIAAWGLDLGETEVLTFAWENPEYRALIDDKAGRKVAKTLGIPVLGTAGMLLLAKQKGIIPSITSSIQALQSAGLWLGDDLIKFLSQQAGE